MRVRECPLETAIRTRLAVAVLVAGLAACSGSEAPVPHPGRIETGTWGGTNAGLIVDDTVAHAHVGCTFGNFPAPVALDVSGRFNVAGSYVVKAYPIQIGPSMPAQFAGKVEGNSLEMTITVNDTIDKKVTVLGPVTVIYGKDAAMGPCPICRKPRAIR